MKAVHWWPAPAAGEIVWCRFPHNLLGRTPGPKPRPALIVKVSGEEDAPFTVLVAYGTSQKTTALHSGEFLIDNSDVAAYLLSGLSYPSKFNFRQCVELPYNDVWFTIPPGAPNGQTPKLGVLHPSLMRRVQAAWEAQ